MFDKGFFFHDLYMAEGDKKTKERVLLPQVGESQREGGELSQLPSALACDTNSGQQATPLSFASIPQGPTSQYCYNEN